MGVKIITIYEEIYSEEEWSEIMGRNGLLVIDVFQKWCGFCKSLNNSFQRIKNKYENYPISLTFVAAQADTIESLRRYRGRCEPCFLFFAGGVMVGVERGVNVPLLNHVIEELMENELKISKNLMERVEVQDPIIAQIEEEEARLLEEQENADEIIEIEVTLVIIKPDAVENGFVGDILEKMKEEDIGVIIQEERHLTEDQACVLYSGREMTDTFQNMINYMCSGPSVVLVVQRGDTGIIEEMRSLLGPPNVEDARQKQPDCWRSYYGTTNFQNGIHCSDSYESAMRELAFFFPDFVNPTRIKEKPKVENTLAIIRPDALIDFREDILEKIEENGFGIFLELEQQMSEELFEKFYEHVPESLYRDRLMDQMLSGPSLFLLLRKLCGVSEWKELLGPPDVMKTNTDDDDDGNDEAAEEAIDADTEVAEKPDESGFIPLRKQFCLKGIDLNLIHGSDSVENAEKEISMIWPNELAIAIMKPDGMEHCREVEKIFQEIGLFVSGRKEIQLKQEDVEKMYPNMVDTDFYPKMMEYLKSQPLKAYLVSGHGGLHRLRDVIGSTDPEEDREDGKTIRGRLGTDIMQNVIHSPSSIADCDELIQHFFGKEIEFDDDGNLVQTQVEDEQMSESISTHTGISIQSVVESQKPSETFETQKQSMGLVPEDNADSGTEVGDQNSISVTIDTQIKKESSVEHIPVHVDENERDASENEKFKEDDTELLQVATGKNTECKLMKCFSFGGTAKDDKKKKKKSSASQKKAETDDLTSKVSGLLKDNPNQETSDPEKCNKCDLQPTGENPDQHPTGKTPCTGSPKNDKNNAAQENPSVLT